MDEPTSQLDSSNSKKILELIDNSVTKLHTLALFATHEVSLTKDGNILNLDKGFITKTSNDYINWE